MAREESDHDVESDTERLALTLSQGLELAQKLLRRKQFDEAERLYRTILDHWPDEPDALHYLGVLQHARGDGAAAEALIRRAIRLMPEEAGPWNNLGNVLVGLQRIDDAIAAYSRSAELDPQAPEAHNNLGSLYRRRGDLEAAEAACRHAVQLCADFAAAWYNLSRVLIERNQVAEGLQAHAKAITLMPRNVQSRDQVVRALVLLGELDEAARLYREWLAEDPDNPVALHHLAACTQAAAPARAPDAYVERVFDSFAESFDAKLASLDYKAPQLVCEALRSVVSTPARQLDIADVGCGTGLCGPLVRQWANRLVGCDLSAGMLSQAKQRGVYDTLHKAELVNYLEKQPAAFDVVISADTLCYFGDLEPVMQAAARAMRNNGILIFTVERSDEPCEVGFTLQPHGRYAHTRAYLRAGLMRCNLIPLRLQNRELRREGGRPVQGVVVSARAGAASS